MRVPQKGKPTVVYRIEIYQKGKFNVHEFLEQLQALAF